MGCCSTVKASEEEEIIIFFNKLLKENNFNLNIINYNENYNKISKMSGNNFKKLCKKQIVRLGFIKIIQKDGKNLIKNKKNDEEIQKILYYIIILTLLLESKINEELNESDNIGKKDLVNLKVGLISFGYTFFDERFTDLSYKNNNKRILYYLAKMFYLCFKDFNNENNYISINQFIYNIQFFIDNNNNCFEDEKEYYLFIRDNILSLGQFFHYNNNYILSQEEIIDKLIELYTIILYNHLNYFEGNYNVIKENINKNIRNNINLNKKDIILPNMAQIINSFDNEENDYRDHKDINLIIESFYYFLKISAQDINSGKKILNIFGDKLKQKNKENEKNEFNDIILLLLFYECCIQEDEKLTLCLLEYITDLFLNHYSNQQFNSFNGKNIYYDIILDSYYLIYKNETLTKQYISLLSQIFMKEIENNYNSKNSLFISQLFNIYYKKEKMMNKLINLFFNFLVNISQYYKEKINNINLKENSISQEINNNLINNLLSNLIYILKTHFINNNSSTLINNDNKTSTNNITYNIYENKKCPNLIKIVVNDYKTIIHNFFSFNKINEEQISIIEFYLYFLLFMINYMDINELMNDFSKKEKIYNNLFKIITKFEINLIQNSEKENNLILTSKENNNNNSDINYILITIQIIMKIIDINDSKNYIQDCYILYKSIEINIQMLIDIQKQNENGNNDIDCINLKIIYTIIFFVLVQFIRLINIPNSIKKHHMEILDCINKSNEKYGKLLSSIDVSNFIINNKSNEPNLQYLKDLLSLKEEKEEKICINYNSLKQILDIIYSKLFGKDTSLNIFFDNQIFNSKYFNNIGNNSYNRSISKGSINITEVKDNSLINHYDNNYNENYLEDISIHIVEKNKQKNSDDINNLFLSNDSKIKIPFDDENIISNEKRNSNSLTNDYNQINNIKI